MVRGCLGGVRTGKQRASGVLVLEKQVHVGQRSCRRAGMDHMCQIGLQVSAWEDDETTER